MRKLQSLNFSHRGHFGQILFVVKEGSRYNIVKSTINYSNS